MPYIKRKLDGSIDSLSLLLNEEHPEHISATNRELIEFLSFNNENEISKFALAESDKDISRVTEDLVYLLISKNIILFTELPQAVQTKLLSRAKLRSNLVDTADDFLHDDEIL